MVSGKSGICCVNHASYQDRANMKALPPEVRKCGLNVMISTLCCAVRLLKPNFSDINVKFSLHNCRSKWVISPPFLWVWFETKNGYACTLLFVVTCSYLNVWLIKWGFRSLRPFGPPPPPPPPPSRLLLDIIQDINNVRTGQEHITRSEKLPYKAYLTIIPRAWMGSEQERMKGKEKASPIHTLFHR